jgi:hypothetical protein
MDALGLAPVLEEKHSYRLRHNSTVGTDVENFRARTRLASPSAAPSTMLMRRTIPRGELR